MSFGFGIGDFITAIELANRIRKEFVDAPHQFKDITNEVKGLSSILRDIDDVLSELELTSEQQAQFREIVEGCRNVLESLEDTLKKYQELDSSPKTSKPKTFGRKARRVWKRLKWEPEDIKELRNRIVVNINLLNAFQGRITSQISLATKDGVDRLNERQDNQERLAMLDWLTPIDYALQQSDLISRREEGTGQWLLNSDKFKTWVNQSNRTLFCPGIPGAGKTMITSIVIEHLHTKFQNDANIGIAYIYCSFRRQQEQKPQSLLASLLKQLVQEQPRISDNIESLYQRHKDKRTRPLSNEISKALHFIVADHSRAFIIIDALDECQVSDGSRRKFLAEIFDLQAKTGINIFATSRFTTDIIEGFKGSLSLEIRASDEDVRRYLNNHISKLPLCVSRSRDLQEKIKVEILKVVDGMFLLAQLHLDSLTDKTTTNKIIRALEKFPKGSKALDHAYKEAMERIEGQIEGFRTLAKRVLSWITHARRPLTTMELRHALAVETGKFTLDLGNLEDVQEMVSACAGLVTVDKESDTIRLIHYTTQEYFERTQKDWFPNAQREIAMTCVTYLSFNAFEAGFCPTDREFETRLQLNPLYHYVARNWGYHVRVAFTEVEQLTLGFLKTEAKVSAAGQAMIVSETYRYDGYSQRVPKQVTGVHLAAYFGLRETIMALFKNGYNPNIKDSYGQTPLSWAVENGHEAVIRLLVERDDVEADLKDKHGRTPLSWAAWNGHEAVIRLLIKRDDVEVDSKDEYGRTPLSWAAWNGHEAVVRLLIERDDVEANSKDDCRRTPLLWAARNGRDAVVKLLVERDDVEADSKDKYGWTPLSWAAWSGHEMVFRLLIKRDDVEADLKDEYGRTPLSWAAWNGHEAVVRLLIERDDVEADSRDEYGRTPLFWAAWNGRKTVVKLLLDLASVEADLKDNDGQTPLSRAAESEHEAVVQLLMERDDVEADSKDKYGRTPLLKAVGNGRETMVKLLLKQAGVNVNLKDEEGQTPLSRAAINGHEAIVRLLLERADIDINSKDKSDWTPLLRAVTNGHETVVKLLLDRADIEVDLKDGDNRTSLLWAAARGHEVMVKLLLKRDDIDLNSKDRYGQMPRLLAAGNGYGAPVKLLLAKDALKPDSEDNFGRTALSQATRRGYSNIINLISEGYDANVIGIHDLDFHTGTTPAVGQESRISCDIFRSLRSFQIATVDRKGAGDRAAIGQKYASLE